MQFLMMELQTMNFQETPVVPWLQIASLGNYDPCRETKVPSYAL